MLFFLLAIVLIAILLQKHSLQIPMEQIHYSITPSKRSVEQGEEFLLKTVIENKSNYRIPFLALEEQIPNVVELENSNDLHLTLFSKANIHRSTIFMKKRQRVIRTLHGRAYRRGVFHFRYATLSVGDFLGLREKVKEVEQDKTIVVFPRRMEDARLSKVLSDVMGAISVNSFMYEDPILVRGYRDYTGCEPLRSISFPMSAKRNQLTIKEFDHTREELVDLILDVSYKGEFDDYLDQLESMFCIVRTICENFEQKGISYRLITNAYYASMEIRGVNIIRSGGCGGSSFLKVLEVLGMASNAAMCKTDELLQTVFMNFSQEKEFIYISQRREKDTEELVKQLSGHYGTYVFQLYGEDYVDTYIKDIKERRG